MAGPTPRPFRTAFICAGVAFIVPVAIASIALDTSGYDGSRMIGFLLALTVLSAVITGFMARRAKMAWSTVKIAMIYVAVMLAVLLLYVIGKMPPHH
jgi:hypothetical protein